MGEFEDKQEVRNIASANNCIRVANKPDSEDICFIPKGNYSAKEEMAIIEMVDNDLVKVMFDNPVARITPGQSAVFYIDDIVVGGGKII